MSPVESVWLATSVCPTELLTSDLGLMPPKKKKYCHYNETLVTVQWTAITVNSYYSMFWIKQQGGSTNLLLSHWLCPDWCSCDNYTNNMPLYSLCHHLRSVGMWSQTELLRAFQSCQAFPFSRLKVSRLTTALTRSKTAVLSQVFEVTLVHLQDDKQLKTGVMIFQKINVLSTAVVF